jgi:hypothetical protein
MVKTSRASMSVDYLYGTFNRLLLFVNLVYKSDAESKALAYFQRLVSDEILSISPWKNWLVSSGSHWKKIWGYQLCGYLRTIIAVDHNSWQTALSSVVLPPAHCCCLSLNPTYPDHSHICTSLVLTCTKYLTIKLLWPCLAVFLPLTSVFHQSKLLLYQWFDWSDVVPSWSLGHPPLIYWLTP